MKALQLLEFVLTPRDSLWFQPQDARHIGQRVT